MVTIVVALLSVVAWVVLPTHNKLFVNNIICNNCHTCVVTSVWNSWGLLTVKIYNSTIETVNTVTVVITPIAYLASGECVFNCIKCFTCSTLEKCVVFRTAEDITWTVAVVLGTVTDNLTCTVLSTVSCLTSHFSLTVAVEVSNEELSIVSTCTDISSEVNSPKLLSWKCVAVDVNIACVAVLWVILLVWRVPLYENFVCTVTVNVTNGAVICTVCAAWTLRNVEGDVEVIFIWNKTAILGAYYLTACNIVNSVLWTAAAALIEIAGSLSCFTCINKFVSTVKLVFSIISIISKESPAYEHTVACVNCRNSSVKVFYNIFSCSVFSCGRHCLWSSRNNKACCSCQNWHSSCGCTLKFVVHKKWPPKINCSIKNT